MKFKNGQFSILRFIKTICPLHTKLIKTPNPQAAPNAPTQTRSLLIFECLSTTHLQIEATGCQSCTEGVDRILTMLKTDSVPGSIGYFMENICPEMVDPLDCEIKVGKWWGYISQIAFNDQVSKYFCYIMDPECHLFTGCFFEKGAKSYIKYTFQN